MNSKKELEVKLSKLEQVISPKASLEQYITSADIASDILWFAYLHDDIKGKAVADLGCGNGILGIGAALLGARSVVFLDSDKLSIVAAKKNVRCLGVKNVLFFNQDIKFFKNKVDTVIQNPPFGVQQEHADRDFLIAAMKFSNVIYSFHKIESKKFIMALAKENGFILEKVIPYIFILKKTQLFHTKNRYRVNVGCFLLRKIGRNL